MGWRDRVGQLWGSFTGAARAAPATAGMASRATAATMLLGDVHVDAPSRATGPQEGSNAADLSGTVEPADSRVLAAAFASATAGEERGGAALVNAIRSGDHRLAEALLSTANVNDGEGAALLEACLWHERLAHERFDARIEEDGRRALALAESIIDGVDRAHIAAIAETLASRQENDVELIEGDSDEAADRRWAIRECRGEAMDLLASRSLIAAVRTNRAEKTGERWAAEQGAEGFNAAEVLTAAMKSERSYNSYNSMVALAAVLERTTPAAIDRNGRNGVENAIRVGSLDLAREFMARPDAPSMASEGALRAACLVYENDLGATWGRRPEEPLLAHEIARHADAAVIKKLGDELFGRYEDTLERGCGDGESEYAKLEGSQERRRTLINWLGARDPYDARSSHAFLDRALEKFHKDKDAGDEVVEFVVAFDAHLRPNVPPAPSNQPVDAVPLEGRAAENAIALARAFARTFPPIIDVGRRVALIEGACLSIHSDPDLAKGWDRWKAPETPARKQERRAQAKDEHRAVRLIGAMLRDDAAEVEAILEAHVVATGGARPLASARVELDSLDDRDDEHSPRRARHNPRRDSTQVVMSPLDVAAKIGRADYVRQLLPHSACETQLAFDENVFDKETRTVQTPRGPAAIDLNADLCDLDQGSALLAAAICGHADCVKLLWDAHAGHENFNAAELVSAAICSGSRETLDTVLSFTDFRARDWLGRDALSNAIRLNNLGIAMQLLDRPDVVFETADALELACFGRMRNPSPPGGPGYLDVAKRLAERASPETLERLAGEVVEEQRGSPWRSEDRYVEIIDVLAPRCSETFQACLIERFGPEKLPATARAVEHQVLTHAMRDGEQAALAKAKAASSSGEERECDAATSTGVATTPGAPRASAPRGAGRRL